MASVEFTFTELEGIKAGALKLATKEVVCCVR